jgi:hypothetical protein
MSSDSAATLAAELSAVVAVAAALISALQIVVARWSSRSGVLASVMQDHWSSEKVKQRGVVLDLEGKDFAIWSDEERAAAQSVALQINSVGFLLRNSYVDRKAFLGYWASWCVRYY